MIHIAIHLACIIHEHPPSPNSTVCPRQNVHFFGTNVAVSHSLGLVGSGPNLPIDLDIIEEWKDLQDYVSSAAGRS